MSSFDPFKSQFPRSTQGVPQVPPSDYDAEDIMMMLGYNPDGTSQPNAVFQTPMPTNPFSQTAAADLDFNPNMSSSNDFTNLLQDSIERAIGLNEQMARQGLGATERVVAIAKKEMDVEMQGQIAMQLLNLRSTDLNIQADLKGLEQKIRLNQFSKQVEQFVNDEMVKEKLNNLFIDLEKTKTENAFQRAKQIVGIARY